MSAELVLDLKLDGFAVVDQQETFQDASGKNHSAHIQRNVDLVADDTFGACASFDGNISNYLRVPCDDSLKLNGDVTVEAWVSVSKKVVGIHRIVGQGAATRNYGSYGLWYVVDDEQGADHGFWQRSKDEKSFAGCSTDKLSPPLLANTWYHLAGVIEGTKGTLFLHDLQGRCLARKEENNPIFSTPLNDTDDLTIGLTPCRMAHVRVYKGARSQAEIEQGIASDRLALLPFRKSHPIDFCLCDEDDQPVLYISDDQAERPLHLEFHNTSAQSIQLDKPASNVAAKDNHHFAVHFRPGTLSESTIKALCKDPGTILRTEEGRKEWALYFPPTEPAANEAAVLYLLYTGTRTRFEPDERRRLMLQKMSAAAGSGARGTQVALVPRHLTTTDDYATPITGSRTQHVHITNHMGRKNIPLHVWFDGGNTILNDGSPQTLTLCLGNAALDRDITLDTHSEFLISFDVGDEADAGWTLTTPQHANDVHVTHQGKELEETAAGQGISKEWALTFPERQVLLRRGSAGHKPLQVTIAGITTVPQAAGHANLYVRYENIPGYQDGQFILTVEKSPLVVRDRTVIGDSLAVTGNVNVQSHLIVRDHAFFHGNIFLYKTLNVMGQVLITQEQWKDAVFCDDSAWENDQFKVQYYMDSLGIVHLRGQIRWKKPRHSERVTFLLPRVYAPDRERITFAIPAKNTDGSVSMVALILQSIGSIQHSRLNDDGSWVFSIDPGPVADKDVKIYLDGLSYTASPENVGLHFAEGRSND